MVLPGGSIMGNTSGSSFELLLMRDYPKCKIVKMPSLRSSTGCQYYREENRVKDYVLKHNPDLLDSGKAHGWFMCDAVHANARGCQIIGRLLEQWFEE
jgi:hypothetical protein